MKDIRTDYSEIVDEFGPYDVENFFIECVRVLKYSQRSEYDVSYVAGEVVVVRQR